MKRPLNFGDLGRYLEDLRNHHYNEPDITAEHNAWKRFDKTLPDFAVTPIGDEAIEKFAKQFREALEGDEKPVTITSYTNKLASAVSRLQQHFEATGSLQATAPTRGTRNEPALAKGSPPEAAVAKAAGSDKDLTYRDLGEYIDAYRKDYPGERDVSRWLSAYNAVMVRVPLALDAVIDPERTEEILDAFLRIATSTGEAVAAAADENLTKEQAADLIARGIMQLGTARGHQFWFRTAMRQYVEFANFSYAEVDKDERRRRRNAAARAQREAKKAEKAAAKKGASRKAAPEKASVKKAVKKAAKKAVKKAAPEQSRTGRSDEVVAEAAALQVPAAPVVEPQALPSGTEATAPGDMLTEYRFLLRPGVRVALSLPDDLTRQEAVRLSRWIDSFVIAPEAGSD